MVDAQITPPPTTTPSPPAARTPSTPPPPAATTQPTPATTTTQPPSSIFSDDNLGLMGSTFSANSLCSSSSSSLEVELDVEEPDVTLRDYLDQEAVESNIIEDDGDTEGSWEESGDNIERSFIDDEAH